LLPKGIRKKEFFTCLASLQAMYSGRMESIFVRNSYLSGIDMRQKWLAMRNKAMS
jgi:hypothetical protein